MMRASTGIAGAIITAVTMLLPLSASAGTALPYEASSSLVDASSMRSSLGFSDDPQLVAVLLNDPTTTYNYGGPLTPAEDIMMAKRIAWEEASSDLILFVEANEGALGGVWFEHPDGGELLVVATTAATTQEQLDSLNGLRPAGLPTRFVSVPHSLADLRAAQRLLRNHQARGELAASYVDVVKNELVIGGSAETALSLSGELGVPVRAGEVSLDPVGCATRAVCTPYRAGINVDFPNFFCTWGWIAKTNLASQLNLISAGHCATLGQVAKHNGANVATTNLDSYDLLGDQQADVARALLSSSPNLVQPYNLIFITSTNNAFPITAFEGITTQEVGETACFDGRTNGNQCGQINATGISGFATRFDGKTKFYYNLNQMNRSAAGGDSGAPVRFGGTALGLVAFANTSQGNYAIYGGIDKLQQSMNVTVCITASCGL